jgi:hypothetical protein
MNSNLLWIYDTVFHFLGHVIRCFMWKCLDSGSAKKSGVLIRKFINFSSGTENRTRLRKSVKKKQIRKSLFCLKMRTTQGLLWSSYRVQSSQWETEYHVSVRTGEKSKLWISNVQTCKQSPSFSLSLDYLKCTGLIAAHSEYGFSNT